MVMAAKFRFFCLLFLIFNLCHPISGARSNSKEEEFSEELLLKPLPDKKLLSHFHFESFAPPSVDNGRHHHLFPKAIAQLGFLHIDEYPPDANQGFDIPSALISFPDFFSNRNYLLDDTLVQSCLLRKFEENHNVHSYTEVLLVPLTTPDFSMPYNVITFVCTILALYFGSLLNVLRRRVGEEERLLKAQAEKQGLIPLLLTKLICKLKGRPQEPSQSFSIFSQAQKHKTLLKVVFVAVAAACYHYLSNDN